ncbi:MAG: ATP-dependent sacrificial sulfur transferase LarE [Planctomycetota bacterium]
MDRRAQPPERMLAALEAEVAACGSAVVAFSAGVDSTLVLAVAVRVLGRRALAVTGLSPSVAPEEAAEARQLADALGARLEVRSTDEMSDPDYVRNASDRCFHCKTGLYAVCREVAREQGLAAVLNGTNADDLGDWRPGLRAADEAEVRSPLLACGLGKQDVRALARHLDLPNWNKPALACLASRLPYGTAVTPERLFAVHRVERHLRDRGFGVVRARHHGEQVRLEVAPPDVPALRALRDDEALQAAVRAAGFLSFTVEPEGYRTGRLNDGLGPRPESARSAPSP